MRRLSKLVCLIGLGGIAATSLAVVHGQPPATDARELETAVDQLGFLPADSDQLAYAGSPAASRVKPWAPANQRSGRKGKSAAESESSRNSSATPRATGRPMPQASSPRPDDEDSMDSGLFDPLSSDLNEIELTDPVATAPELAPMTVDPGDELSAELETLQKRVRKALSIYYPRQLNTQDHNPWEMMHAIIAYGVDTKIHRGGSDGKRVNAIAYLSSNGRMHGLQLLALDRGRVTAQKGVKLQGHYGQLLAILAQSRVKTDYPLRAGEKEFTLADLIETEKLTCRTGIELTFKLISFAHYLDSDETWEDESGEKWDIPRLISEELKQPILSNAACGGTHRLMGFAYAVRNRKKQDRPIDGQWLRAQKYLDDYHKYTFALQNPDGSFSTEWFRRREAKDDINRRIQTTGHILEWIVYSLPEQQLDDPRLIKAVKYLSGILLTEPKREWEIGPLGHAIHALSIYDHRRFKPVDEARAELARRTKLQESRTR